MKGGDPVKEFLSRRGVPFTDKNVREDPAALEELRAMGYSAVPVTIVDGQRIVGFDREAIERATS
ncbi:MAG: glutaredoxin family protein [Deltaproteobacteria bacterium]|nr:glutaredoxin family protein [Deltaproteobacteria bacterium]